MYYLYSASAKLDLSHIYKWQFNAHLSWDIFRETGNFIVDVLEERKWCPASHFHYCGIVVPINLRAITPPARSECAPTAITCLSRFRIVVVLQTMLTTWLLLTNSHSSFILKDYSRVSTFSLSQRFSSTMWARALTWHVLLLVACCVIVWPICLYFWLVIFRVARSAWSSCARRGGGCSGQLGHSWRTFLPKQKIESHISYLHTYRYTTPYVGVMGSGHSNLKTAKRNNAGQRRRCKNEWSQLRSSLKVH